MATSPSARHLREPAPSAPPPGGGRDALIVFIGTLGIAAFALNVAVMVVPERFGLLRAEPASGAAAQRAAQEAGQQANEASGADETQATSGEGEPERLTPTAAISAGPQFTPRAAAAGQGLPFGEARPFVPRASASPTLAELIFEDSEASIVHVTTLATRDGTASMTPSGTGSGLVWDRDGHIVTSSHVVDNINGATVMLASGDKYLAKYVGQDPVNDLAVIRIDAPADRLKPVRFGSSADLRVGMQVFNVACPYGLEPCLMIGTISGLGRSIRSTRNGQLDGMIQTDAPLHPGSSGGALIDDQGRVVGMNAAVHKDFFRYTGVGFAIPIDVVRAKIPLIIQDGYRWHRRFGFVTVGKSLSLEYFSDVQSAEDELEAGPEGQGRLKSPVPTFGLVVEGVMQGSSAAAAGLRGMQRFSYNDISVRDIIVSAGGRPVEATSDLESAIRALGPNEPLVLEVARPDGVEQIRLR